MSILLMGMRDNTMTTVEQVVDIVIGVDVRCESPAIDVELEDVSVSVEIDSPSIEVMMEDYA